MKTTKRVAALLIALLLAAGIAHADTLSLNGTVEAGVTVPVYAPIGGTVESVSVEKGVRVSKGQELFGYRTEKIYAAEDGTVAGVFVKAGDDAETVTNQYGADLYIEGAVLYSISASTSKAYSSVATTLVHTGEKVYILCRTDANRKGTGIISTVDGSSYTVLVTSGSFINGDSVTIYRDKTYADKQRVGRGNIARVNPTAVNATGAVVNVAVKDGDKVKRGDLLMETLTGTFDGYKVSGTTIKAETEGVVTSVAVEAGATVNKGDVIAQIAPISGMRVEATISADDRKSLKAGDKVLIELEADESKSYEGTVKYITEIPEEETEDIVYKAIIDFKPDDSVFFGMTVVVTKEAAAAEPAEEPDEEPEQVPAEEPAGTPAE